MGMGTFTQDDCAMVMQGSSDVCNKISDAGVKQSCEAAANSCANSKCNLYATWANGPPPYITCHGDRDENFQTCWVWNCEQEPTIDELNGHCNGDDPNIPKGDCQGTFISCYKTNEGSSNTTVVV